MLRCLFALNRETSFSAELKTAVEQGKCNAVIGSLARRAQLKYGLKIRNPYCEAPLDLVLSRNLSAQCDFENIFSRQARLLLKERNFLFRSQALLVNGQQTPGNFFAIEGAATREMEKIIRSEVENYRAHFVERSDGLIAR